MPSRYEDDLSELEEFLRLRLADAQSRYQRDRTAETKNICMAALREFSDLVKQLKPLPRNGLDFVRVGRRT